MKFNSKTMTIHNADSVPYLTYNSLSEIDFINHAFPQNSAVRRRVSLHL